MKHWTTLILLCAGTLLAADFWQNKKPSEWTEKEARKIIENSPWVKEVQPGMDMAAMSKGRGGSGGEAENDNSGGRRGGGGMGGPGGGPGGRPGGAMGGGGGPMSTGGGGGGGMQMPRVKVSFETALPVAEAKARMEIQDAFKGVRDEFVVISLSGMRMMGGGRDDAAKDRKQDMQDRLLQMTTIKLQADKVYQPADVKMQQTVNGPVILFAFPRKELLLGPDDKQLLFKTSIGPMQIEVKFNLKDMVYEKQLSL